MKPSVGRVVHYVSYGTPGGEYESTCRAAVITAVKDPGYSMDVTLFVMSPTGVHLDECHYDEETKLGGTWHWPERVDD
jgi:hypothetical protein